MDSPIDAALNTLSDKEQAVVRAAFSFTDDSVEDLGMTEEEALEVLSFAMRKLRHPRVSRALVALL